LTRMVSPVRSPRSCFYIHDNGDPGCVYVWRAANTAAGTQAYVLKLDNVNPNWRHGARASYTWEFPHSRVLARLRVLLSKLRRVHRP
jgi:hypothetical protein